MNPLATIPSNTILLRGRRLPDRSRIPAINPAVDLPPPIEEGDERYLEAMAEVDEAKAAGETINFTEGARRRTLRHAAASPQQREADETPGRISLAESLAAGDVLLGAILTDFEARVGGARRPSQPVLAAALKSIRGAYQDDGSAAGAREASELIARLGGRSD
jgi:hypothetical protein